MRFLILLPLLVLVLTTQAQFTVLGTNGNVYTGDRLVQTGDVLTPLTILSFEDRNAEVFFTNDTLAFFTTQPTEGNQMLSVCMKQLETKHRGFKAKAQRVTDLPTYFGNNRFTVLGDSLDIPLDEKAYPLNESIFLVFQYRINSEQQSKKIGFNNQVLQLRQAELFTGRTQTKTGPRLGSIRVIQYEADTKKQNRLADFELFFVPFQTLQDECHRIQDLGKVAQQNPLLIRARVEEFLYGRCGRIDPTQLQQLLASLRP